MPSVSGSSQVVEHQIKTEGNITINLILTIKLDGNGLSVQSAVEEKYKAEDEKIKFIPQLNIENLIEGFGKRRYDMLGFDAGTMNLVKATRGANDSITCTREVNAFIEIPLASRFTFNMLKKAGVPLIERQNVAYAVGEKAVEIAYSFSNLELRRPMASGCVNPREKEAYQILSVMIHSLIGEVKKNNEVLCYSVPANAINETTDIEFHQETMKMIMDRYSVNGKKVMALPVNEALALVYAELQHKMLTGAAISWGSGMSNFCYANRSVPVLQFSVVGGGDWIDRQAAKALAESPTFVNKEKTKIDLTKSPTTDVERAIQMQYRLLIRNVIKGVKEGMEKSGNKIHSDSPIDMVVAGGTASPNGFEQWVREEIDTIGLPVQIGTIVKPSDNLFSVARGLLLAAEAAEE